MVGLVMEGDRAAAAGCGDGRSMLALALGHSDMVRSKRIAPDGLPVLPSAAGAFIAVAALIIPVDALDQFVRLACSTKSSRSVLAFSIHSSACLFPCSRMCSSASL